MRKSSRRVQRSLAYTYPPAAFRIWSTRPGIGSDWGVANAETEARGSFVIVLLLRALPGARIWGDRPVYGSRATRQDSNLSCQITDRIRPAPPVERSGRER